MCSRIRRPTMELKRHHEESPKVETVVFDVSNHLRDASILTSRTIIDIL